jgi:hypothetical protein
MIFKNIGKMPMPLQNTITCLRRLPELKSRVLFAGIAQLVEQLICNQEMGICWL